MTAFDIFKQTILLIWSEMSKIIVPVLNIPVTSLLLGSFIICVSISILFPLLGIGAGAFQNAEGAVSGSIRSIRVKSAHRYNAKLASGRRADAAVKDVKRWV